jgi:hypothetical protein
MDDAAMPLDETRKLSSGKARYIGVSNFPACRWRNPPMVAPVNILGAVNSAPFAAKPEE